jgi:hypothetical protein
MPSLPVGGNTGKLSFHSSVDELAVRLAIYIHSGWQKARSARVVLGVDEVINNILLIAV